MWRPAELTVQFNTKRRGLVGLGDSTQADRNTEQLKGKAEKIDHI